MGDGYQDLILCGRGSAVVIFFQFRFKNAELAL
jgi:hypothetical protein